MESRSPANRELEDPTLTAPEIEIVEEVLVPSELLLAHAPENTTLAATASEP